jgi:ABC-type uncharacterized transport system permease subunit
MAVKSEHECKHDFEFEVTAARLERIEVKIDEIVERLNQGDTNFALLKSNMNQFNWFFVTVGVAVIGSIVTGAGFVGYWIIQSMGRHP